MLVKKQKPQPKPLDMTDDLTHPGIIAQDVVDLNGYGAIPPGGAGSVINAYGAGSTTISSGGYTISTGSTTVPYTFTTNGTGGAGQFLTTGAGGTSWNTGTVVNIDADGLTMKKGADIKIGGKSLTEAIEKIEERLGILHPNSELEERWSTLKELRKQYMELEKDILEKEKIMKILKEK
jgi:hypothetical protein